MPGYPQTPTFPIDLRGGKGIKVNRTGPTANTIVLDAILGNDVLAPMPAGTLKANLLGSASIPQDVTLAVLGTALGLKGAAYKDVGVAGGVASFDDPRFATVGAPTVDSIVGASASGKALLKGTPLQGRNALEIATVQSAAALPPWTVGKGSFDRVRVSVGEVTPDFYPGGGVNLGAFSALTGTLDVPAESDQAVEADGNPLIIISAGVSGLVRAKSTKQVGVGLVGNVRIAADNGRGWGANLITANFESSYTRPQYGRPAQINGLEIDCTWQATQNPITGSNLLGIWLPAEFYGGRPDGAADAIRIGRYADFGWKNFLSSDHGSADKAAQFGITKRAEDDCSSPSQGLYWISSESGKKTSGGDSNVYRHSFLRRPRRGISSFSPITMAAGAASKLRTATSRSSTPSIQ